MKLHMNTDRIIGRRDIMIYGHFIEHFHRQIYGGIYDPGNSLSDESGLRSDVLEAMRKIRVPILRWPGGCFVSSYHWKDAVVCGDVPEDRLRTVYLHQCGNRYSGGDERLGGIL